MAASIFGERFVGMRKPAWHGLGTVLQDQVTAEEALKIGGVDYQYVSAPIGYTLPDGTFVETTNRVAVLREPTSDDPTYRSLGIVSSDYKYLQNTELASGLDAIAELTGWKFETIGALGHGEIVFMTLDAGSRDVAGDEYKQYFIVSDGKAVGRALTVTVAPVRVVCQNTLLASDSSATISVKIGHNGKVASDYSFWLKTISSLQKSRDHVFTELEQMTQTKITPEQAAKIFEAAFPYPRMNERAKLAASITETASEEFLASLKPGVESFQKKIEWFDAQREAAALLYARFNSGEEQGGKMPKKVLSRVSNTPYAAVQAVTELADWTGSKNPALAATSALFGWKAGAKRRAWAAALNAS